MRVGWTLTPSMYFHSLNKGVGFSAVLRRKDLGKKGTDLFSILIHRRTPIPAAVMFLANPSICHQLFGDHSIHKTMTEQQNRSFAGKGLKSSSCRAGAFPRSAGGFDSA